MELDLLSRGTVRRDSGSGSLRTFLKKKKKKRLETNQRDYYFFFNNAYRPELLLSVLDRLTTVPFSIYYDSYSLFPRIERHF
jgi:hypothetical protein